MNGMDAASGARLSGLDHLRQSIRDILMTPVGTRIMRRDYGSRIYELVDAPTNPSTILQIFAATAGALRRWEPRFRLQKVQLSTASEGKVSILVTGTYLPDGQEVTIDGVVIA